MKKLICAATLGSVAALSSSVSAFDPATGADITIYHAGASASSSTFFENVVGLCLDNDNLDVFWDLDSDNAIPDQNNVFAPGTKYEASYWAIACETDSTKIPGLPGGTTFKMFYSKRDSGGSAVGVYPLAGDLPVAFMKIDEGNCPGYAADITAGTREVHECDYDNRSATNDDDDLQVPNFGSSDVEPALFAAPSNNPQTDYNNDGTIDDVVAAAGNPSLAPLDLTRRSAGYLGFGIVGNLRLWQALQYDQFPSDSVCNPGNASYDASGVNTASNALDCMPSLTKAAVASLMARNRQVDELDEILDLANLPAAVNDLDKTNDGAAPLNDLNDNFVEVCRRVEGSGTQAQNNVYFFNYPCDNTLDGGINTAVPAEEDGIPFFGNGFFELINDKIAENAGSSDLSRCLNDYQNGTNDSGKNARGFARAAIGLHSTTKSDGLTSDYRFFKIDGVAPTIENMQSGRYQQYFAQSYQTNPGNVNANQQAVFDTIVDKQNDPVQLGGFNKVQHYTKVGTADENATKGGWQNIPSATNLPSTSTFAAPIARFPRVDFAASVNSCALPTAYPEEDEPIDPAPDES